MATTFTDRKGRTWDLSLDLRKARVVDNSDFSKYWDKEFSILVLDKLLIQKLLTDAPFLFAVIWALVQEEAEEKWQTFCKWRDGLGIKPDEVRSTDNPPGGFPLSPKDEPELAETEFVSGVNGPTIEAARSAMIEALGDFFPDQRTVLLTLAETTRKLAATVGRKMVETMPLVDQLLEKELDEKVELLRKELLEKTPGETSSVSPPTVVTSQETSGEPGSLSST